MILDRWREQNKNKRMKVKLMAHILQQMQDDSTCTALSLVFVLFLVQSMSHDIPLLKAYQNQNW